jgi:two-component system, chemotaxis family, CheB/CheR fusion protein
MSTKILGADGAKETADASAVGKRDDSASESSHLTCKTIVPVVGIGSSAGGLEALTKLLQNLAPDTGLAFVIIQHLDPTHESLLADLLARINKLPVQQATDGVRPEPNHVYVVPPNSCMTLEGGLLRIETRQENSRISHMPIDHFLRSLAHHHGNKAVGIILSGTGTDGALGIKEIKEKGGIAFAQEPTTAKFSGMPQSAISTGSVDFVLTLPAIAKELTRIARHPYLASPPSIVSMEDERQPPLQQTDETYYTQIFKMLRAAVDTDFTHYKHSTIRRRITRRMTLLKMDHLGEYVSYLKENPHELKSLYHDLLIKVTSFFRDPETFEELKSTVIPRILENHTTEKPLRIWVPACATGEESYSVAICFLEYLKETKSAATFHIFATDVDEVTLQQARTGQYLENIALDVSPERLARFFTRVDHQYRINKSIRGMCTFAKHNLAKDPPFSNLDLISCRNVLIYFDPVLQKRIIPIFHYALKPSAFLTLGPSETIGSFSNLFALVDKKHKIYIKKPGVAQPPVDFIPREPKTIEANGLSSGNLLGQPDWKEADVHKKVSSVLLKFAPAGVLINEQMEILQFHGDTSHYLIPAPGKASHNVLKMARPGLLGEIKAAVAQATLQKVQVHRENIHVRYDDKPLRVNLKVVPIEYSSPNHHFVVLFEEVPTAPSSPFRLFSFLGKLAGLPRLKSQMATENEKLKAEIKELRQELDATKEYLQSIIENQDATNEELKSANEEILSSNEELQSTNEELETAKEELQSTNEELSTVNEEVQNRNLELSQVNNDLNNLFRSATIPIIMLGSDLRVRRFTPIAQQVLNILPTDIGLPLEHLRLHVPVPDLQPLLLSCIENDSFEEREVQDLKGHWYSIHIRPYKTDEHKVEGALIFFINIDSIKGVEKLTRTLEELKQARTYNEWVVETLREPLLILDTKLHVISANPAFYEKFHVSRDATEHQAVYNLGNGQWNIPELHRLLEELLPKNKEIHNFEVDHHFPVLGRRSMLLNARRLDHQNLIFLAIEDITERKAAEQQILHFNSELEEKVARRTQELTVSNQELETFCYSVAHDLRTPLRSIVSFSQLLEMSLNDGLAPEPRSYLQHSIASAKQMTLLIDHLLELSRVTRKEIRREKVDLSSTAESLIAQFRHSQPDRQVDFRIAPGLTTEGDGELLRIALHNLLENAWKFTSKVSKATIDFGRVRREGNDAFFVRDNGVGFNMAHAGKLFGLFQRLHEEKEFAGSGMGLATVQRIIQRHGGQIWVDAEVGHGATFYFTLKKD